MSRPYLHDQWAPLAHKEAMGDGAGGVRPPDTPHWLPLADARRTAAYRILAAYRDNVARYHLPDVLWQRDLTAYLPSAEISEVGILAAAVAAAQNRPAAEKYREYGHAGLLVHQARSLLLGDAQDVLLPDLQDLTSTDGDPADDAQQTAARAADLARLQEFDDWLQAWAEQERLRMRLLEGEEHSIGSGDTVYALGWSEQLRRPRLRVYEPDAYLPDLDSAGDDDEYPRTVHLAWEYVKDREAWLRRTTWRLVDLADLGELDRLMAWHEPGDPKATRTCLLEVVDFRTSIIRDRDTVYSLDPARGTVVKPATDLGVDFMPVVHVPNDAAGARHFGRSILLLAAQALDDLSATDTDLQANSELVGSTPLVTKGAPAGLEAGPGAQWNVGAGGDARLLDTSKALDALIKYEGHLAGILDVNTRLSSALLGRIAPNEVPSGYALELGFTSTRSLVREMRMVRDEKYPLLLRMVLRLAQAAGVLPGGPTPRAEIALGGFLPADKAAAVEQVTGGLKGHAMSRRTGVQVLIEAGFPIDDAEAEVDRIAAEATAELVQIVDALGQDGVDVVRERLGLPVLPRPTVPLPPPPPPPASGQ